MKKLTAFLFGLTLAISVGVLAQDSVIPSKLRLQSLGVNAPASTRGTVVATASTGVTTPIRANGDGTNDVEILVNSPAGADAYVRTTAISATNWSAGVRRATSNYVIANGVGLATPVLSMTTAGVVNVPSGGDYRINGASVVFTPGTFTGVNSSTVGPLTFNSGNFTAGVTGCTTGTGPFVVWIRRGWQVSIQFSKFSCTSNSGLFNITGFPAEIRPGSNSNEKPMPASNNGSANGEASCHMSPSGSLECSWQGSTWTSSGTKYLGSTSGGTSVGFDYSLGW